MAFGEGVGAAIGDGADDATQVGFEGFSESDDGGEATALRPADDFEQVGAGSGGIGFGADDVADGFLEALGARGLEVAVFELGDALGLPGGQLGLVFEHPCSVAPLVSVVMLPKRTGLI